MSELLVEIIMGSKSDWPKMVEAEHFLDSLGVPYEMVVASAHRDPEGLLKTIRSAEERGVEVFIAGAGMAAHLPGFVASRTSLPVIGVPLVVGGLGGLDALLSMVQMPSGVPVATVTLDGAKNAALLAARILSLKHPNVRKKLLEHHDRMTKGD